MTYIQVPYKQPLCNACVLAQFPTIIDLRWPLLSAAPHTLLHLAAPCRTALWRGEIGLSHYIWHLHNVEVDVQTLFERVVSFTFLLYGNIVYTVFKHGNLLYWTLWLDDVLFKQSSSYTASLNNKTFCVARSFQNRTFDGDVVLPWITAYRITW